MRRADGWPHVLTQVPKSADPHRDVEFVVEVPTGDGGVRPVRVVSHALPGDEDAPRSYLSRLTVPAG